MSSLELRKIQEDLNNALEDIFLKAQAAYGVDSGDIEPFDSLKLEHAARALALQIFALVKNQKRIPEGTVTRTWRVYGTEEVEEPSYCYDFSDKAGPRIIEVKNSDILNDVFTEISISMKDAVTCEREFYGQLYDGIFEESDASKVEEVLCEVAQ